MQACAELQIKLAEVGRKRFGRKTLLCLLALMFFCVSMAQSQVPRPDSQENQSGITRQQAEQILSELRQIHELLLKQQAQPSPVVTPAAAIPSENLQMNVGSNWYSLGQPDAPVTIVEFADYQCPFCRRFQAEAFARLKKNYIDTGKVRFVSRDLPFDYHPYSLMAAEAARCAGDQGRFWEIRDALISNESPWSFEVITKTAEALSLDMNRFRTCVQSQKYKAEVQRDASEAVALQINGTPTFLLARSRKDKLEGVRIVGAQPFATFQSLIDGLLKTE